MTHNERIEAMLLGQGEGFVAAEARNTVLAEISRLEARACADKASPSWELDNLFLTETGKRIPGLSMLAEVAIAAELRRRARQANAQK